ncbi:hypothetical protein CRUP_018868 [Coryphaenoides rupestris]|nr:hypothetical protein CRUP_018868 [Coryphaenoides rupestris]
MSLCLVLEGFYRSLPLLLLLRPALWSPRGREDLLPTGFPNIDMGPQLKVVERTRTATMLCAASGNPDPEITWYKDFLPIDPGASNGRIKQLRSEVLCILTHMMKHSVLRVKLLSPKGIIISGWWWGAVRPELLQMWRLMVPGCSQTPCPSRRRSDHIHSLHGNLRKGQLADPHPVAGGGGGETSTHLCSRLSSRPLLLIPYPSTSPVHSSVIPSLLSPPPPPFSPSSPSPSPSSPPLLLNCSSISYSFSYSPPPPLPPLLPSPPPLCCQMDWISHQMPFGGGG